MIKVRYIGNAMNGPQGTKVRNWGMDLEVGAVYDLPDTLGEFLLKEQPNEWRKVDYAGKSRTPGGVDKKYIEKAIGGPMEDHKPFVPNTTDDPSKVVADGKNKMMASKTVRKKKGKG